MRKCIRCGAEMVEGCDIRVEGAGNGVVLAADARKLFSQRMGKPEVWGDLPLYGAPGGAVPVRGGAFARPGMLFFL